MGVILLIEDDAPFRDALRVGLEDAGHEVVEAASGHDGLDRFNDSAPDLVITDVVMNDGEGIEVVMTLKKLAPGLPVIAISGNPEYLRHSRTLGASQTLLKPFAMRTLLACIASSGTA
jgi:DNA-binding response OmpR family regulator